MRPSGVVVGLLLLATVSCSGERTVEDGPKAGPTPLSNAQLQAALLTRDDVEFPYVPTENADTTAGFQGDSDRPECAERFLSPNAALGRDYLARVDATFYNDVGTSIFLFQSVMNFSGSDAASEAMDRLRSALADCENFSARFPDGESVEVRVAEQEGPRHGDETVAYQQTTETGEYAVAYIRAGSTVAAVSNGGEQADDRFGSFVEKAAVRLQGVA